MPSIIPSYMYSIFAALLVGAIVVYACSLSALNVKEEATSQQLINIEKYVATQSIILISHTTTENQNNTQILELPSQVGNQQFRIALDSDSAGAWVKASYGTAASLVGPRVSIPASVSASGFYISGSGQAVLVCSLNDDVLNLTLTLE